MSEAIVQDLAAVATHASNTPLILQRLPLERARTQVLACFLRSEGLSRGANLLAADQARDPA
jgi:hypothetical protein